MSRIYDNWEKLVAAVIKRDEIWELCHSHSRNTSISSSVSSSSSDFDSSFLSQLVENTIPVRLEVQKTMNGSIVREWKEIYETGVNITIAALENGNGITEVKRVGFSKRHFNEDEAKGWWHKNRYKVYSKYNAWGRVALDLKDELLESGEIVKEWSEQYDAGVSIKLRATTDGTLDLRRVRFSRRRFFNEDQAEDWWENNREEVYKRYNIVGSVA